MLSFETGLLNHPAPRVEEGIPVMVGAVIDVDLVVFSGDSG